MTIEFFEKMCNIDSDKTYVSKAKLKKIAVHMNVSADWLLGIKES